jgi:hypothetical protein
MREALKKLPGINFLTKPEVIFLSSLLIFSIDNVANYFVDVPVFVAFSMLVLPLIWLSLFLEGKKQHFLIAFSMVFLISAVVGNLRYDFSKSSIADLAFILMFATSYFYYKNQQSNLKRWPTIAFLAASILMFGFAFFGVNSMSLHTNEKNYKNLELVGISFDSLVKQGKTIEEIEDKLPPNVNADSLVRAKLKTYFPNQQGIDTMKNIGVGIMPEIQVEKESLDKIENSRKYHYGLFRIPHVPAYFFGFLLLFCVFLIASERRWIFLIPAIFLAYLILFNGVRTFVVSLGLSVLIWFFVRRNIWFFVIFTAILASLIIFRYELFNITQNTILQPLSSLLITVVDNPDRLSRVALFRSWYNEIREFSWLDYLTGRNFYESKMANLKNLLSPTWFHNDVLSISFAYGIPATLLYILFFYRVYRDNIEVFRQNAIAFIFFLSIILTSVFNGFYYYFPIFLLYIFWLIAGKNQKTETA